MSNSALGMVASEYDAGLEQLPVLMRPAVEPKLRSLLTQTGPSAIPFNYFSFTSWCGLDSTLPVTRSASTSWPQLTSLPHAVSDPDTHSLPARLLPLQSTPDIPNTQHCYFTVQFGPPRKHCPGLRFCGDATLCRWVATDVSRDPCAFIIKSHVPVPRSLTTEAPGPLEMSVTTHSVARPQDRTTQQHQCETFETHNTSPLR
jgi:hypothetical protein